MLATAVYRALLNLAATTHFQLLYVSASPTFINSEVPKSAGKPDPVGVNIAGFDLDVV